MTAITLITAVHTALSLLAIVSGFPAVLRLFNATRAGWVTDAFVPLAIATSVSGFLFPFHGMTPPVVTAIIALLILGVMLLARHRASSAPFWRRVDAVGVVASLYLLLFVGVVQVFLKVPALHRLAPTQSEPPFALTQMVLLGFSVALGIAAALRIERPTQTPSPLSSTI